MPKCEFGERRLRRRLLARDMSACHQFEQRPRKGARLTKVEASEIYCWRLSPGRILKLIGGSFCSSHRSYVLQASPHGYESSAASESSASRIVELMMAEIGAVRRILAHSMTNVRR